MPERILSGSESRASLRAGSEAATSAIDLRRERSRSCREGDFFVGVFSLLREGCGFEGMTCELRMRESEEEEIDLGEEKGGI